MNKRIEVLPSLGDVSIGDDTARVEELYLDVVAVLDWDEWHERHPRYGSPDCPKPDIERQGWRLQEVWLAVPFGLPNPIEEVDPHGLFVWDGNQRYLCFREVTDQLSERDFEDLEEEARRG